MLPRTALAAKRAVSPTRPVTRRRSAPDKLAEFDNEAFFGALDSTRASRGLTWKEVAEQSGVSASTLTRMAQGKNPDVDGLAALLAWSGLTSEAFVKPHSSPRPMEPLAKLLAYFRRDPRLSRESANMLEGLVTAAYERLTEKA
jgi:transcriptional regulator with XRE-family HTH domain